MVMLLSKGRSFIIVRQGGLSVPTVYTASSGWLIWLKDVAEEAVTSLFSRIILFRESQTILVISAADS